MGFQTIALTSGSLGMEWDEKLAVVKPHEARINSCSIEYALCRNAPVGQTAQKSR